MKLQVKSIWLVAVLVMLGACSSATKVQNAPLHAGTGRTFQAKFEKTLSAAREAVVETGLQIESASQVDGDTWMIIAKKGTSAWSWGELVRVVVVRDGDAQTTVRVHSARRVSPNVAAKGDYALSILSNIELKLNTGA